MTERGNTHSYMRAEVKLYKIITDCRTVRYHLRQGPWWLLENAYIFMVAISLLKPISIVQLEKKHFLIIGTLKNFDLILTTATLGWWVGGASESFLTVTG